jgi:ABC-2 type transport system ATP-binding protein
MTAAGDAAGCRDLIRVRGLEKRFGTRRALAGVDLVVERPEIVGIVGPGGAGKTTLLRALVGLLEIEAAEAIVLGHDLRGDVTALKAKTGYVPQTFSLHRGLTVAENLRFTARLHRLPETTFRSRSHELLAITGLEPFVERPAGALSGGMKQKLAIACALLPTPALLVLDEPTAGVDVVARAEIWAMLEREKRRAAIVMSTSYLDEAAACDRLVYLESGRVLAAGSPAVLGAATPLAPYRVWGDDPRAAASAARELPYVAAARASGRFARIDITSALAPSPLALQRALAALPGATLAEPLPPDMESTLLALARGLLSACGGGVTGGGAATGGGGPRGTGDRDGTEKAGASARHAATRATTAV